MKRGISEISKDDAVAYGDGKVPRLQELVLEMHIIDSCYSSSMLERLVVRCKIRQAELYDLEMKRKSDILRAHMIDMGIPDTIKRVSVWDDIIFFDIVHSGYVSIHYKHISNMYICFDIVKPNHRIHTIYPYNMETLAAYLNVPQPSLAKFADALPLLEKESWFPYFWPFEKCEKLVSLLK